MLATAVKADRSVTIVFVVKLTYATMGAMS